MSLVLVAQNVIESASSVTVSPAAASGQAISRIYDRDKGPQYAGGSAAQTDIDIDLGASPGAVTGWALVNHNITGVTITLFADSTSPPATSRDTIAATAADFLRTFASLTLRYWRIRIPAMASVPKIGEALLGQPRTIALNPLLRTGGTGTIGNVRRDLSPGGYRWAVQRGAKRARLGYAWSALADADLTLLKSGFDDCNQGAKNLLVQDPDSTLRWMSWLSESLDPVPIGNGQSEVAIELEEAL